MTEPSRTVQTDAVVRPARPRHTGPRKGRTLPPAQHQAELLSVILPASNEAGYIGACLAALCAQDAAAGPLEVVVVANGCHDDTAARAQGVAPDFETRGWRLRVIERAEGGKTRALNAGDACARGTLRVYLDADVICAPELLGQLRAALAPDRPLYATGRLEVAPARSWVTRRFADLWTRLPFVTGGAVGAGLFAVNAAGRARWGEFPDIISDDTFVRLQFSPQERIEVPAAYRWPMVEGFAPLVRVRRRQDAGVDELRRLHPALMAKEGKAPLGRAGALRLFAAAPVSFLVYATVLAAARSRRPDSDWSRGR